MSDTRIVILGGGFGGLQTALELERALARRSGFQVTLVNRENFFLFTPMLHEVAASDLDVTHIVVVAGGGFAGVETAAATYDFVREALRFYPHLSGRRRGVGRGVARILGWNFSGFVARWLWRTIYLAKLPRFEKKLRVALDWTLDLVFAKELVQIPTKPSRGTGSVVVELPETKTA